MTWPMVDACRNCMKDAASPNQAEKFTRIFLPMEIIQVTVLSYMGCRLPLQIGSCTPLRAGSAYAGISDGEIVTRSHETVKVTLLISQRPFDHHY